MTARARHRLAVAALAVPIALWAVVGFALNGEDGQGELMIRLVLLLAVALGAVWLVAAGFDARHPASKPLLVLVRLVGVTVVVAIALFATGDPWVFAGEAGSAVSVGEQAVIAGLWLAALGATAVYWHRPPPVGAPVGPPPAGVAVSGPAPRTGFGDTVRRWPHVITAMALVGPLIMVEAIVAVFGLCGIDGAAVNLAALLVLTVPIGLPGIGVLRDRQVQRRLDTSAAAAAGPVTAPGFAVAFGTMVLIAIAHLALLIGLLVLAGIGADGPRQCFN